MVSPHQKNVLKLPLPKRLRSKEGLSLKSFKAGFHLKMPFVIKSKVSSFDQNHNKLCITKKLLALEYLNINLKRRIPNQTYATLIRGQCPEIMHFPVLRGQIFDGKCKCTCKCKCKCKRVLQ